MIEQLPLATRLRRVLGWALDTAVIGSLLWLTLRHVVLWHPRWGQLLFYAIPPAYYLLFEGVFRRTLGKLLLGMRVVTEDGARPTLRQIILRTALRMIPFDVLWALFGRVTTLHDDVSDTLVVTRRKAK